MRSAEGRRKARASPKPPRSAAKAERQLEKLSAELRLRTAERDDALAQQAASAKVMRVINSSPGELAPVFDAILEAAHNLCGVARGALQLFDGGKFYAVAVRGQSDAMAARLREGYSPGTNNPGGRLLAGARFVHIADLAEIDDPVARAAVKLGGTHTALFIPLRKDTTLLGQIVASRAEVKPFSESEIGILEGFAAQAVIAMENARLLEAVNSRNRDLEQSLERQTATSDILRAIAASPGEAEGTLRKIAETTARLFSTAGVSFRMVEGDEFKLSVGVGRGAEQVTEVLWEDPARRPTPGGANLPATVVRENRQIQIRDLDNLDPEMADWPGPPVARAAGIRTMVGTPLRSGGRAIGAMMVYRAELRPFDEVELQLLQSFADQAVIAIENTRLLTETREALERQTATAEVLQVINSSPGELAPVFEAILEKAHKLCAVSHGSLQLCDGETFRAVAVHGLSEAFAARLREGYLPGPNVPSRRVIEGARFAHVADLGEIDDPVARAAAELSGIRTTLFIPLRKDGVLLGQIVAARQEVRPFTEKEITLLESFAAQAVIAMENARLLRELRQRTLDLEESLEYQTATSDVLKVISRSTFDLEPVLATVAETAARLCHAEMAWVSRRVGDVFRFMTAVGTSPETTATAVHFQKTFLDTRTFGVGRETITGRVLLEGRALQIADLTADSEYKFSEAITVAQTRTMLGVPLLREGEPIGTLTLGRQRVEPFTERQIELVSTFADQAVIAIENTRLLTEQREALEQQTATAEVLQVINSSPGDLPPVFDAMLEKAMRLCDASFGQLITYDGDRFRAAAWRGYEPETGLGTIPKPGMALYQLVQGEQIIHVPDITADDVYRSGNTVRRRLADKYGARTAIWVALRKEAVLLGAFVIYRTEIRPFSDKQIALLQNFAAQAVIAMENARLITETREALEQQTATAEILQVINRSPGELAPVFDAILEKGHRLCGVAYGSLQTYDGERFRAVAVHDLPEQFADLLRGGFSGLDHPVGRAFLAGDRLVHLADCAEIDHPVMRSAVELAGIRTALFVPLRRDEALLGMIVSARREVQPFTEKEIALLESFAAQAVIAMENARLLGELRKRQAELARSVDELTATGDVLKIISRSSTELETVLETLVETVARLCRADQANMFRQRDGKYHLVAAHGLSQDAKEFLLTHPLSADRGTMSGRVQLERRVVHIPDVLADSEYAYLEGQKIQGHRTMLGIPLLRGGAMIGIFVINRTRVEPYTTKEIELATTFADQAVIAIENARLFEELRERQAELARSVDELTATGDVLKIISRSSVDLGTVLDTMVETVARLCHADLSYMFRRRDDKYHLVTAFGLSTEQKEFIDTHPFAADRGSLSGRVEVERRPVHIPDVLADPDYTYPGQRAIGYRTLLGIPLLRQDALLGVFVVSRMHVEPFTDKEIELATTFADQAVIAIENARLFEELRDRQAELARSVDELTATGDVLKSISRSSVDLETVLDTLVETVGRLCRADQAAMFRLRDDMLHLITARGLSEEAKDFHRIHPLARDRGSINGRVALERRAVHIPDVLQDPEYTYLEGQKVSGFRTMLAVPLLRGETLIGTLNAHRTRVEPYTAKEIELATTFADQAVIAIENARLFDELRERQAELRVTFDNMGDGVAMFDAERRLAAWNRNLQEMLDLPHTFLAERPSYADLFRYLAERGEFGSVDLEAELRRNLEDTSREIRYERTRPDGRVIEVRRNPVPGGGFVLIYADITERKRAEAQISAARDAAETALRELQTAQASLLHSQKMAALGQLTAGIAHEIKNPLNFVNNFAGLSNELLSELKDAVAPGMTEFDPTKRAEIDETLEMLTGNLKKIVEHGRRADGIVKSMLAHSRGGSGDWQAVDLNAIVEEALNLAYHGARAQDQSFNISMERDLDRNLAPVEVVPQDVTRVFLNLIGNGFYAANKRKRDADATFRPVLQVATRDLGDAVEIRVRDNGVGIAREHRERLFQPFFTTKPTGEGTGLGLSISYDIVTQQHGGDIIVDSEVGSFTEFTVRLPRRRHVAAAGRSA